METRWKMKLWRNRHNEIKGHHLTNSKTQNKTQAIQCTRRCLGFVWIGLGYGWLNSAIMLAQTNRDLCCLTYIFQLNQWSTQLPTHHRPHLLNRPESDLDFSDAYSFLCAQLTLTKSHIIVECTSRHSFKLLHIVTGERNVWAILLCLLPLRPDTR